MKEAMCTSFILIAAFTLILNLAAFLLLDQIEVFSEMYVFRYAALDCFRWNFCYFSL